MKGWASGIWRYMRLYAHFVAFSISRSFEFRFDFYMRILMDLCYYTVSLSFFKIIYLHTPSLGGWNEKQMMVFVSGTLIVDAIVMTFFSNNMWKLPILINKGDLDYYLVRPVSSLFFVSLREFAVNSFVNLLFALGIFFWAVSKLEPRPHLGEIALFLLLIFNGALIFYCLNFLANIAVFWTQSSTGFGELVWTMARFGEKPDGIFYGKVRRILTTFLPFAVISSFPARIIINGFRWNLILHMLGVSTTFLGVVILCWNKALKSYSSASS